MKKLFTIGILLFIGGIICVSIFAVSGDFSGNLYNVEKVINGSGNVQEATFTYEDDKKINLFFPFAKKNDDAFATVIFDKTITDVKIKTDKNILDALEIDDSSSTLLIKFKDKKTYAKPTSGFYIYLPDTENEISLDGIYNIENGTASFEESKTITFNGLVSGNLTFDTIENVTLQFNGASDDFVVEGKTKILNVTLNGAAEVTLKGITEYLDVTANGAADIEAFALLATNAKIEINGAAEVEVNVKGHLEGVIRGVGEVNYKGSPTTDFSKEGLGSFNKVD